MIQTAIVDSEERLLAIDPSQSFICEAPAGSGKTELLTQRFLTLLAHVSKPEEILAITFTRKAAGEMQDRIVAALKRGMIDEEPTKAHEKATWRLARAALENDRKFQWDLVAAPGRLRVLTFDSLCAGLAQSLPMHSSFASPPPTVEDASELYELAVGNFIDSMEEDKPWSHAISEVLLLLDNNMQRFEGLLANMLARRDSWLPLLGRGVVQADSNDAIKTIEESLEIVRNEAIAKLKDKFPSSYASKLMQHAEFAASNLKRENAVSPIVQEYSIDLPASDNEGIEQWMGLLELLLTKDGTWRKQISKTIGFPPGSGKEEKAIFKEKKDSLKELIESLSECEGLQEALLDLKFLPASQYGDQQKILLSALVQILPVASAYLNLAFKEQNQVDFTEVSLRALQALNSIEGPSELALALDHTIQHILVDEFQDTSPTQMDLIELLISGWQQGDGRTLFCVGDAMQSIYSFRNAKVGLFLNCLKGAIGNVSLEAVRLSTNFRSQKNIVSWVNTIFSSAFPQDNDVVSGAVKYSHSEAINEDGASSGVSLLGFLKENGSEKWSGEPEENADEADPRVEEAESIVESIKATKRDASEGHTIAILVRSRKHILDIALVLQRENLRYRAVELESLSEHMLTQDLISLTRALINLSDRIAWLSILRAPWCGLKLIDLECISASADTNSQKNNESTLYERLLELSGENQKENQLPLNQGELVFDAPTADDLGLSQDACQRLDRFLSVISIALKDKYRRSLRTWVEGVWIALGGPACVRHKSDLSNARLFFNELEKYSIDQLAANDDVLIRAMERLRAAPDPLSDDSLQIMTIHKSKGLEFDTVIVPSLDRKGRNADTELLKWQEHLSENGEQHLLLSSITAKVPKSSIGRTSTASSKDSIYSYIEHQENKQERNERLRLLYVACTRAKKQLLLTAQVALDNKGENLKAPAKGSLLSTIWGQVKNSIELHGFEVGATETKEPQALAEKTEIPEALSEYEQEKSASVIWRHTQAWAFPKISEENLLASYIPFYQHNDQAWPSAWEPQIARAVGTAFHLIVSKMNTNVLQQWRERIPGSVHARWRTHLFSLGIGRNGIEGALSQLSEVVQCFIGDEKSEWLLSDQHRERRAEYALNAFVNGELKTLIVDLLIDDGKATWIVDYKTSAPEEGESVDSFISKEMESYQATMLGYLNTVKAMGYKNVCIALYFPRLARWEEYKR